MLGFDGTVETDVLIIGTGAAGCRAAIEAAEFGANVLLISKGVFGRSGTTNMAEVVYAAAIGHTDRLDKPFYHFEDTIVEGHWLGNQRLVNQLADGATKTVFDLERYGLPWYRMEDEKHYYQLPTPGHRFDRGVHFNESTGKKMQSALVKEVERHPSIRPMNDYLVTGLFAEEGEIRGASAINLKSGNFVVFQARAVIIATGGAGVMYEVTDMEHGSTGDGIAMAFRAGARLIAPEMHQFFPTAFAWPDTLKGVIVTSSNLWKFGLRLYNAQGDRFMEQHFPIEKENVPRDVLSRFIFQEIMEGRGTVHGGVWLDTTHIEGWDYLKRERARSYIWPEKLGVDSNRFEIVPTYHFTMGGIEIDACAQTNIRGLYAAGEVVGGIHGANRIGGNALPECMVFGAVAGRYAALNLKDSNKIADSQVRDEKSRIINQLSSGKDSNLRPIDGLRTLKHIMYRHLGIVREASGLESGLEKLGILEETDLPRIRVSPGRIFNNDWIWRLELGGMIEQAKLYITAALMRKESRGAHFRSDYPETDNHNWLKNIVVINTQDGPEFSTFPVEFTYIHPDQYQEITNKEKNI